MDEFRSPNALGILYAEDFDEPIGAEAFIPDPAPPPLTAADVEAACTRAVEAAQAVWQRRVEVQRTAALELVAAGLTELRAAAEHRAEAAADAVARTALRVVAGALPALCRKHGDNEVKALMASLLPLLAPQHAVVIRVHAGLVESLQADIAALGDGLIDQVEVRSANLAPGDVRLAWEDGSLVRDTGAIRAAIEDSLSELGLFEPAPESIQERSLALAR